MGMSFDVFGERVAVDAEARIASYLPSTSDIRRTRALMRRRLRKGSCASWIAPPGTRLDDL
jgi:hypothetical protein